jgi:hypothetical protein
VADAIDCLDYLERFGSFDVNFTPLDDAVFAIRNWLSAAAARAFLREEAPDLPQYEWGDIFVKYRQTAAV